MIEKIFIPTYGRVGKQKTYHNLPKKYQKKTYLVIRIEELDLHKDIPDENLIILNDEITNVAETRKAIAYLAGTTRYAVFDDDLGFKIRYAKSHKKSIYYWHFYLYSFNFFNYRNILGN